MKAVKLDDKAQHVLILEEDDRLVHLLGNEVAIILDQKEGGDIAVNVHFPKLKEDEEVPLNAMLAACVKEFLHDPSLVQQMQDRIKEANKRA